MSAVKPLGWISRSREYVCSRGCAHEFIRLRKPRSEPVYAVWEQAGWLRPTGRPSLVNPAGRSCPECGAVLSIYNPGSTCWLHGPRYGKGQLPKGDAYFDRLGGVHLRTSEGVRGGMGSKSSAA